MKISDLIEYRIDRFRAGYVFTYIDFEVPMEKTDAFIKALSRLVASGKIVRLSKGQFYKLKKEYYEQK